MKTDVKFEFIADLQNSRVTVKRVFAANRQVVWDCYTKRELLDRWFAPKPLVTQTKHMDFRAGGFWHFAMVDPTGQQYWSRQDYLSIDPINSYTALDGFCDATGALNPDLPRSTMIVNFTEVATSTLVETVVSYPSPEAVQQVIDMGMKEGIASTLERLDELLVILS